MAKEVKEELVHCVIPIDPACPEDKSCSIWINGFKTTYKRGVAIDIPKEHLRIIEETMAIRAELNENNEKIIPNDEVRDVI